MSSISSCGRIVTINTTHNEHGIIKLAPLQRFPQDKWYDPSFVRSYRNSFLEQSTIDNAYGLDFSVAGERVNFDTLDIRYQTNTLVSQNNLQDMSVERLVFTLPKSNTLVQKYSLKNISNKNLTLETSLNGLWGIIRASYAQITENGPIPFPETDNHYSKASSNTFMIKELGTHSYLKVSLISNVDIDWNLPNKIKNSNQPIHISNITKLDLAVGEKVEIFVCYSLADSQDKLHSSDLSFEDVQKFEDLNSQYWKKFQVDTLDEKLRFIINRNFAYTYGCCCLRENGAMITDHQSLPLTWNRDNYFMFKLLESVFRITNEQEIKDYMLEHINWLFTYMTDNGWGRSHVINGKIKDKVFQFDQQCYPVLEAGQLH